ncbi:MAG: type IV pili methyl-accepting chemotaxis transducer N-terminal domain-containing protein [Alicycliphilus sp.]|nr:type IV pili methyl-accepting chemotaxis transducer N-terminal domain-containing protein [Alicycliphilus sp.]MBP7324540.1 type IV pili methyl-accepting chemotaxis transducer N-terminal domain-containing protein [Alicycliphilus sp.]MBP7328906.1 type IV pili methyl-accepting chemotaxis transducer N-terminal domain-containing protein [Alicycliphilus sp.]MBP8780236.1 type IV pili methyl-accepting chemotaxis transducer N-terminal domain-containing protein [Alicycliphilus sp.]
MLNICLPCVSLGITQVHRGRRVALRALAAAMLMPALPSTALARMALATAINRTARFRAMSQRTAKLYGQLHLNVRPERAREALEQTRRQVRADLDELDRQAWPPEVARLLADVRRSAERLDGLTAQPAGKSGLQAVSAQADQMLTHANSATQALEHLAQAPTARLVNMAGRQRMLSQRLAKNYGLVAAGLDSRPLREQIAGDAEEFQRAMAQLAGAPLSTPAIRTTLELGQGQWVFFDMAIKRQPNARGLEDVATTSERLLEVMDSLTALYEVALQDVLG